MTSRYFDAIVLGRSVGALSAAALLSRRDFRVLVLGQGERPCSYEFEGLEFRRRTFSLLASASPSFRRVLHELAQSPLFRRRLSPLDPMLQVLLAEHRLELPPDVDLFSREIDREFPEVRQIVDELYAQLATVNAVVDQEFERDLIWPPGSLWERFMTGRAAERLPLTHDGSRVDLMARFPSGHPYRDVVTVPAVFASNLAAGPEGLPPLALARLHGTWTRGMQALGNGEEELVAFLVERIEAQGGVCRLESRASSLVTRRGRVVAVVEDGEDRPVGTGHVITSLTGEELAALSRGEGVTGHARQKWPHLSAAMGRFVVSAVVGRDAIPKPMAAEVFIVPRREGRSNPREPVVHVQKIDATKGTAGESPTVLLVAETLLPSRGALSLLEGREAVLSTLRLAVPFLDEHLVAVDSPCDGLPLWRWTDGVRRSIDRVHVRQTSPTAEPMEYQYHVEPTGYLGLAGEPLRGPIPGTFLVGKSVLPALGQEGEVLAACSVAHLVTSKDGSRRRMRRQMWSRTETT